jgi:acyl-coenzyme A synthetase/AMP-(fatty) acid ligase
VSSAGALSESIAAEVLTGGLARLVDIYGSSETSGIAMRDVPANGYDLSPCWQLSAHGNQDWRLVDRHGWFCELPDYVERISERSLRPVGRRDGAVQVAGHNVSPERVARTLQTVEGVVDAAVRLHANGRLKAFVVLEEDCDAAQLSSRIEQAMVIHLADHERPKSFRFGPALPRNAMEKLEDWP